MTDAFVASVNAALSPQDIEQAILSCYDGVKLVQSWGETSFFYNPGWALARGAYFCTLKDHDGEHDRASALDRNGVYRLSLGVTPKTYELLFGPRPARPSKGGVVEGLWDFNTLNRLTPHPVYAWMGWISVLNPSAETFIEMQTLLGEAHGKAEAAFRGRLRC